MNKQFCVRSELKKVTEVWENGNHQKAREMAVKAMGGGCDEQLAHIISCSFIIDEKYFEALDYLFVAMKVGGKKQSYIENHAYILLMVGHLGELFFTYLDVKIMAQSEKVSLILLEAAEKLGRLNLLQQHAYHLVSYPSVCPGTLRVCADVISKGARPKDAIKLFKKLKQLYPSDDAIKHKLAQLYKVLGYTELAVSEYKNILQNNPGDVEAHRLITTLGCFDLPTSTLQTLVNVFETSLCDKEKSIAAFALSGHAENQADYTTAFGFLDIGNKLEFKSRNYDHFADALHVNTIMSAFYTVDANTFDNKYTLEKQPVLIVGMPRSGSTLVEQILSSHSEIFGAGEVKYLSKAIIDLEITPHLEPSKDLLKQCETVARRYQSQLNNISTKKSIIVDKMLSNYYYLGFLLSICPNVKVIDMRRSFMAVAWSIYKRRLPFHDYSYNLDAIYITYKRYRDLMMFWKERFPDSILDFDYEALVMNKSAEVNKLLDFLEIGYDEKCLDFHLNSRVVRTASSEQVRKKIYSGSSDAWRRYENMLGHYPQLFDELETKYYS